MPRTRIMVVEDDRIIASHIKSTLIGMGYDVCCSATSGEEAITKAEEVRPELVLMDIVLEGKMDGIDAASHIRSRFHIPVVFLTAFSDSQILERAKLSEPFGYIIKPFEDRELQSVVEIALYKHSLEKKLRESEGWLSTTLKSIGDGVIATDVRGNVTFMNPVAEALSGWKEQEALGKSVEEIFFIVNEKTAKREKNPIRKVLNSGRIVGLANHTLLVKKDGVKIPIDNSGTPIKGAEGNIIGAVIVFRDISDRRKAEHAIQAHSDFLNILINSLNHPFFVIDAHDFTIKLANSFLKKDGLPEKTTCHAMTHKSQTPCKTSKHPCPLQEVKRTKKPCVTEHVHFINNEARIFEVYGLPILDSTENVVQMIEYSIDITDHRQMEDELKASLQEKDMLLKEIHRQAKNNLHIVHDLLGIQAGNFQNRQDLVTVNEMQNRIKSMIVFHEKLYQAKSTAEMEYGDFLRNIISNLLHSPEVRADSIGTKIEIQSSALDVRSAIPCGLILNELVSNTLKHAFPEELRGNSSDRHEIRIKLSSDENDNLILSVSDNGVGFPGNLDFRNINSLGLQLVKILVKQLGGHIQLERTNGTSFLVTFKKGESYPAETTPDGFDRGQNER